MKPEVTISNNYEEEKYKQALADAVYHAVNLLKEEGVISINVSTVISAASKEIGREICRHVKDIAQDTELVEDEEVMHHMDTDLDDDFEEVPEPRESYMQKEITGDSESSDQEEEEYHDLAGSEGKSKQTSKNFHRRIAWQTKVKAVTMARQHPNWSLNTIRSKTTRFLTSRNQLWKWKQAVERKGTSSVDRLNIINDWTYKRFMGARFRKRQVTTRMLQQWATERAQELISKSFQFKASRTWVDKFKRDHNILQRRIIRFINKADPPMLEVMVP